MRNEEECVCSVYLFRCTIFIGVRIIKEMPGSVVSGTPWANIYIRSLRMAHKRSKHVVVVVLRLLTKCC